MKRFLNWLSLRLPCRIIDGPNGEPYLERYFLFRIPGFITCYLHRFVNDDPDRGVHDHPWNHSLAIVLSGSYQEMRLTSMPRGRVDYDDSLRNLLLIERRVVRRFNYLRGDSFHRVVLNQDRQPAWTLFIHGRRCKGWGFLQFRKTKNYTDEVVLMTQYQPYSINRETGTDEWWKNKPLGRDELRRVA